MNKPEQLKNPAELVVLWTHLIKASKRPNAGDPGAEFDPAAIACLVDAMTRIGDALEEVQLTGPLFAMSELGQLVGWWDDARHEAGREGRLAR
jgi:hypothetical protein